LGGKILPTTSSPSTPNQQRKTMITNNTPSTQPDTQQPADEGLDETPCSRYIPFVEIPEEIHAAAQTLHIYFEKQGMREWEFSYLADRRLVTKLERERDAYREQLQNIANASPRSLMRTV
jgi:hypothetical protein